MMLMNQLTETAFNIGANKTLVNNYPFSHRQQNLN